MNSIRIAIVALLALSHWATAQDVTTNSVGEAFTQARVVPDVLPSFDPQGVLEVVFADPTSSRQIRVTPGMNLTRSQTSRRPVFGVSGLPPSFAPQTFVLVMVDPDAPTPQNSTSAQIRHFLGGDFALQGQLNETTPMLANQSQAITEYSGPNPPAGSTPHRYVILLYNQNTPPGESYTTMSASFVNDSSPRSNFNITRFAQETQLTGPVAGTFFYVAPSGDASSTASGSSTATMQSTGSNGAMALHVPVIPLLCLLASMLVL